MSADCLKSYYERAHSRLRGTVLAVCARSCVARERRSMGCRCSALQRPLGLGTSWWPTVSEAESVLLRAASYSGLLTHILR